MTPSLRITTVLFVFLALFSCSSPKLEEIKGLPEKAPVAEETRSESAPVREATPSTQPAGSSGTSVSSKPIEPPPLAPPPTEPGSPPMNGGNGSNGGLNVYEEPNGKEFERTQTGVSNEPFAKLSSELASAV